MAATKEQESTGAALLRLLDNATAADLAELDEGLQREIDSLSSVRRKSPEESANGRDHSSRGNDAKEVTLQRRRQIAKLLGAEGPMAGPVIMSRINCVSGAAFSFAITCDWFAQSSSGSRLTEVGRRESGI